MRRLKGNARSRGGRRSTLRRHPRYGPCAVTLVAAGVCGLLLAGCGGEASGADTSSSGSSSRAAPEEDHDRVVSVDGKRGLYVRCTGSGSPTVVMEGGDGDTSSSYAFAEPGIAEVTRTCVYDRANLGRSDAAAGPRRLSDLVGDLEALLQAAEIPGPYVLVGTSGGGYITAGYAYEHPDQVAGMVFVDTGAPLRNPPRVIVEETDPDHPSNLEHRDYLQVEKDAWAARKRIGDFPVTIISNQYSSAEIKASPFPSEARGMRRNVSDQKGWLVLSPRAKQVVVHTGHAVEEEDPQLVIDAILDVVKAAREAVP